MEKSTKCFLGKILIVLGAWGMFGYVVSFDMLLLERIFMISFFGIVFLTSGLYLWINNRNKPLLK